MMFAIQFRKLWKILSINLTMFLENHSPINKQSGIIIVFQFQTV